MKKTSVQINYETLASLRRILISFLCLIEDAMGVERSVQRKSKSFSRLPPPH